MRLPPRHTLCGRILDLLMDGQARSRLQIREELGLPPETEVTARIRDLRRLPLVINCVTRPGRRRPVYVYRMVWSDKKLREQLQGREAA